MSTHRGQRKLKNKHYLNVKSKIDTNLPTNNKKNKIRNSHSLYSNNKDNNIKMLVNT